MRQTGIALSRNGPVPIREKFEQHNTGTVSTIWSVGWEDEEEGGTQMDRKRVTIKYKPRDQFRPFHNRKQRWSALVCHRCAGKARSFATHSSARMSTSRDRRSPTIKVDDRPYEVEYKIHHKLW
jgi:hypothetical protein